jgi:hypothetical protein
VELGLPLTVDAPETVWDDTAKEEETSVVGEPEADDQALPVEVDEIAEVIVEAVPKLLAALFEDSVKPLECHALL